MITEEDFDRLQKCIGYEFKNRQLLREALTHSSFSNEQKINRCHDYERLEFLGDSVLEMVSSAFLYRTYPDMNEGKMTKLRASMVCETALAYCAQDIMLEQYIMLGKGEEATGGRHRDSIISDVMESVIGAIYLDGGIEPAQAHINKFILSDLENKQVFYDSKSVLQEMVQKKSKGNVEYELIGETGPEHDKMFTVIVRLGEQKLSEGEGRSKKSAEQQAAYKAINKLKREI